MPLQTQVGNLSAETSTGGIFVANTGALNITGGVISGVKGVQVTTSGDIVLTNAGSLSVTTLGDIVKAPGNVTVTATGAAADIQTGGFNDGTVLVPVGAINAGGTATVTAGRDLLAGSILAGYGDIDGGGSVVLNAGRDISIQDFTYIDAHGTGTVSAAAGRSISLGNLSHVSSQSGAIALTAGAGGELLGGDITTNPDQTVTLNSGGTILQTGAVILPPPPGGIIPPPDGIIIPPAPAGIITTGTLTVSSVNGTVLNNDNQIGNLGKFDNTGLGGVAVTNAKPLTVSGPIDDAAGDTGDVTLVTKNAGSNLTLSANVTTAANQVVTLTSAGKINQTSGIITTGTLTGSSAGGTTLNDANRIGSLGKFDNTGSGDIAVSDAQSLTVSGAIGGTVGDTGNVTLTTTGTGSNLTLGAGVTTAASQSLTLSAAGNINQTGGIVTSGTLTGQSGGSTSLTDANQIQALNGFTSAGAFSLTDNAPSLTIGGTLNAAGQTVTLNEAGGGINASGGVITAGTLTGSTAGAGNFSNANNVIGTFGPFTNSNGALTLNDNAASLTLAGTVDASGQTLTLNETAGGIDASAATVKAATVTGSTAGTGNFSNANNMIGTLGGFSNTAGALSVSDNAPSLALAGTVDASGQTLTLNETGGGIDASAATVKAATLTGSTAGAGNFANANNMIGTLGSFSNTSGALSVTDNAPSLTLAGTVDASGQTLTLNETAGGIDASAATVKAATLTGSTAGAANFSNSNNMIGTLGSFSNTAGSLTLSDNAPSLALSGTVDASGQMLTLNETAGGIDASAAAVKAATLTGSTAGAGNFSNANNLIGTLGSFSNTAGALTVSDNAPSLALAGTVDASGQTLTLNETAGGIDASVATVKAATLTGSTAGAGNFSNPNNSIGALGDFTNTGGAFTLFAANPTLIIAGNENFAGQTATIVNKAGGILETTGTITAGALTGAGGGGITLNNANHIDNLDAFTQTFAAGAISITNAGTMNVRGNDSYGLGFTGIRNGGGDIALTTTGANHDLRLGKGSDNAASANGFVTASGFLTLNSAGAISEDANNPNSVVISAGALTAKSVGGISLTNANHISDLDAVQNKGSGNIAITDARALNVAGKDASGLGFTGVTNVGNVTLTTTGTGSNLTLAANVTAPANQSLTLSSAGNINQTAGTITTGTLTGQSGGSTSLTDANQIQTLNGFTSAGAFSLTDNAPSLTIGGTLNASGQTLTLNETAGGIDASAATVKAATLTGSTAGAGNFSNSSNLIGTLGSFSNTAGALSLTDNAPALTLSGTVDASGQTLTLNEIAGGIDASAATVKAATLTGSSAGAASFTNANNAIATFGGFSNTSGPLSITDGTALTLTGAVDASGQTLTLNDTTGGIDASAATVKAATLTGSTAGAGNFSNANNLIGTLGSFSNTAGALNVTDHAPSLTLAGTVDASGETLTLNETAGGIDASAAVVKAATLTGSTAGAGNFSNANNLIGVLGSFSNTAGALTVSDNAASLTLAGPVDASGQTLTLTETAGGIGAGGASVKAGTLTGASAGAASFTNANNAIATFGGFSNTSGPLSITDGTSLALAGTVDASGQTLTINETGGGVDAHAAIVKATTLTGSAAGAANFSDPNNLIGILGDLNVSGPLTIADNQGLAIIGNLNVPGQAVTVTVDGTISQTSGTITAGSLSTTSVGATSIASTINTSSGGVSVSANGSNGDVSLAKTAQINAGAKSGTQTVSIKAGQNVTIIDGSQITSGTVSVDAAGNIIIGNSTTLGSTTEITGGNVNLTVHTGDILIGNSDFITQMQNAFAQANGNAASVQTLANRLTQTQAVQNPQHQVLISGNSITLTLGTNTGFEQQNTGTLNSPDGIQLTPGNSGGILIQTTPGASQPPLIIDMFATVKPGGEGKLTSTSVASSAFVVQGKGLPQSNYYRVNGCVVGAAGACSIFPFTFLNVDPNRLTQVLIIRAPEQVDQNDPTLTAGGNDETVQP
ncbi:MAG TPA: hypothetical protein VFW28_08290 [Micropepsaceae bacterium]|nr:hypothetical protein [Micropepsaceae bacterium]